MAGHDNASRPVLTVLVAEDHPLGSLIRIRLTGLERELPGLAVPILGVSSDPPVQYRIENSASWQLDDTWTGEILLSPAPPPNSYVVLTIEAFETDPMLEQWELNQVGVSRTRYEGPWTTTFRYRPDGDRE